MAGTYMYIEHPDDDAADVAVTHFGDQQIGTGFLQRRRDSDPAVEVIRPRIEIERPIVARPSPVGER